MRRSTMKLLPKRRFCTVMIKKTNDYLGKINIQRVYDSKPFNIWLQETMRALHFRVCCQLAMVEGGRKSLEHQETFSEKTNLCK